MKKIYLKIGKNVDHNNELIKHIKETIDLVDNPEQAEAIFVFGGDGTMLHAIRNHRELNIPFYGFNFGHLGFLMNTATTQVVEEIINGSANFIDSKMLKADTYDEAGKKIGTKMAFNDFYFERIGTQAAKLHVSIDGKTKFNPLLCDGLIVSSSAGSTAYNASAGGVILPINTNTLAITAVSPAIFHYWRSAQIPEESEITIETHDGDRRPTRFVVDGEEIKNVHKAIIVSSKELVEIGFANSENYNEKVLNLQFSQH